MKFNSPFVPKTDRKTGKVTIYGMYSKDNGATTPVEKISDPSTLFKGDDSLELNYERGAT